MLTKLHNHLLTKSNLYSKYHSTRFHNHIHWGVFGFVSTMLSMKILAVLLAITFLSILPLTQTLAAPINKTWDSQSDWSPWSKDQTSSDVTAGAVTLAPDNAGYGSAEIIHPGETKTFTALWTTYGGNNTPDAGDFSFGDPPSTDTANGGQTPDGFSASWSPVADLYTDQETRVYTTEDKANGVNDPSVSVTFTAPLTATPGLGSTLRITSLDGNHNGWFDSYEVSIIVPGFYPKGTTLTTYDGQSNGSNGNSYIWSDLTKNDTYDTDEGIVYYALADNSSSDPTIPTHDNAGTESNWTTDGWTPLSFSSDVADLTGFTNTRYLHIAAYIYSNITATVPINFFTDDNASDTPSINSLSLNYTLTNITVTAPNGGETWYYSQAKDFTKLITWTLDGATSDDHIHLQYSTDNGATWSDITGATNLTYTDTSFTWTLPKVDTTQAQIKAILENSSNTAIATDINDANFNLKPMSITITSPENPDCYLVGPGDTITGCATTTAGLTKTITWTTQGASQADHIKLEYSTNNGSTWTTLSNSLANSATSYDWTLPTNIKSTQALVRGTLEDSSNLDLADDSTGTFTIHSNIKPTISPTDPSDGASIN